MADTKLIVYLLILSHCMCYSQGSLLTNQGNNFIIGFSAQHFSYQTNGTNRIYITSDTDATVRLRAPAISLDTNIKLLPGIPRHVDLPGKARMKSKTGVEKKGIQLTSKENFAVYGMNLLTKSSDGFLGLPVSALGTDYVISTFIPVMKSALLVVATEDDTRVAIDLKLPSGGKVSYRNRDYFDGSRILVILKVLEAFQIDTNAMVDLSGTRVTSDKPVSVFSGCDCAYVPVNKGSCDHLVEQILPVKLLGTQFITIATANRTGGDLYHVIAAQDGTVVTVDAKAVKTIQAGQRFELDSKYNESHVISTSKPSLVMQYAKSYSVDNSIFDPFMSTVPAISQYSNDYNVFIPVHLSNQQFFSFVSIAAKTQELDKITITQNNHPNLTLRFSDCSVVQGSSYSVCTKQLNQGIYRVFHRSVTEKFALVMYGTWRRESFGFPMGLRFESPGCKLGHMTPGDGIDNDCDNSTDEEIFNNMDDDGDGRIDEDLATKPPSLTVPNNITKLICNNSSFDHRDIGQATGEAYGKCKLRGHVKINFTDILNRTECHLSIARKWTITDGCSNIKETNQYIFVRFPSKTIVEFPKDLSMSCREKTGLSTSHTGEAKVISNRCDTKVKIRYQDSMFYPCTLTERKLERDWIVSDECGRLTKHKQVIRLLPLAVQIPRTLRNFKISLNVQSDVLTKNNETVDQLITRVQNQIDKAIMSSSLAHIYFGSSISQHRTIIPNRSAIFIVRFQNTSSPMPDEILTNLRISFAGILSDIVNNITVQDYNECGSISYKNYCARQATCVNTLGSFSCVCSPGLVGDGFVKCDAPAPVINRKANIAPPSITYITVYTEAGVGENVTIRCDVHGIPDPKVSWKTANGRILDKEVGLRDITTLDDGTRRVRLKEQQEDNSLLITDVQVDDGGLYTCMAKNSFGHIRREANLTVRTDRIAVAASVTLLDETFSDKLKNRDSWRFRTLSRRLTEKLIELFKDVPGFQKVEILKFEKGSVKAFFRVVAKGDESPDTCQSIKQKVGKILSDRAASGYIGDLKVEKSAKLQGRPPAPANLQSSDVKETSVKVTWEPPSFHKMYGVSTYTVQYKEFGSNEHPWRASSVTSLTHTLTRLKPGASYMVRAKSKNEYGASDPSNVLEITTVKERSTTEWLVLILIPILVLIIIIFVIVCIVRVVRRKGRYNPTATEEVGMVRLQSTPGPHQTSQPKRSWRPFRSNKFTLEHSEIDSDKHYIGNPMNIKKIKRTSDTEERLLLEPGDQRLWQEISRDQITLGEVLGEGEFGKVYKGTVTDSTGKEMTCAVKSLKSTATESDFKDLLNELEIMASVGHHNNVIDLIGVCASGGPLLAVVEYAVNGNLLNYLRRHRRQNYENMADYIVDISAANRLKFACEISKGMSHLARMKCVHRDLAARNVLLGESLVAKVSDFGLSRDVYTDNVYEKKTGGKLPARWMALESLEFGMYSSQSDVWSFGVVLWEIETGGATPFASYTVAEIMEHFKVGRRLGRPTDCNRHLYAMMLRCWNSNPDRRPTFNTLTHELKELYQQETMYVNFNNMEDTNRNQKQLPSTIPEEC